MNKPPIYEIRVEGHLGERWFERFEGLSIRVMKRSFLWGKTINQLALLGVLHLSTH